MSWNWERHYFGFYRLWIYNGSSFTYKIDYKNGVYSTERLICSKEKGLEYFKSILNLLSGIKFEELPKFINHEDLIFRKLVLKRLETGPG